MCAICGIVNFSHEPVSEPVLIAMRDTMVNRGPDSAGAYVNRHVGFGHRRLKIIDLSENASQPMPNEDQSVWVTFNGEIYDFQPLRENLLARGHKFKSQSDTEVIVHGYEEWGEKIFERIDGMFAIAIWDARKETLLLGRDRFGKKPLYFRHHNNSVHFASDIKAIWSLDPGAFTLNHAAIDCYLHHLGVTQDHCVFNEVSKVQPGNYHVFTRDNVRVISYWRPSFRDKLKVGEEEVINLMDTSLKQAVKRRMISDVPLGAFLSGGVDSSVVVAMMSQASAKPCRTFSIGFEDLDYSELKYSRQVAQRYQTDHQEIMLKPDVLDILPALVWEYGEPFADSSAIPTYYVSKAARQFVTVALTGDGGDEMFGGYDIARASYYAQQIDQWLPAVLKNALLKWLLPPDGPASRSPRLHQLKTLLIHGSNDPAVRHGYSMAFNPSQRASLYTPAFKDRVGNHVAHHIYEKFAADIAGLDIVDQNLFLTIAARLPNDYLVKVDVASMKSALELRCPFLDTDLCTLASSIDSKLKVRGGRQKYLLKKLAERYLPHDIIYRKKQGFELPLDKWLRHDFAPLLEKFVLRGRLIELGWFDRAYTQQLIQQHVSGTAKHTHRLWSLLWLELWHRLFIDRTLKPTDSLKSL